MDRIFFQIGMLSCHVIEYTNAKDMDNILMKKFHLHICAWWIQYHDNELDFVILIRPTLKIPKQIV
jgi:hypothetical protein